MRLVLFIRKFLIHNRGFKIPLIIGNLIDYPPTTSGRITWGGGQGGLAPLVVLMAPLVQLIFRGSGRPQNGPLRVAKRPS